MFTLAHPGSGKTSAHKTAGLTLSYLTKGYSHGASYLKTAEEAETLSYDEELQRTNFPKVAGSQD